MNNNPNYQMMNQGYNQQKNFMGYQDPNNMQQPMMRQSSVRLQDLQRFQRERRLMQQKGEKSCDIVWCFTLIVLLSIFLINDMDVSCNIPIRVWLFGTACAYVAYLIFDLWNLHYLNTRNKDHIGFAAMNYIVLLYQVCWLIYGNTLYYSSENNCAKVNGAGDLNNLMFAFILLGYLQMLKCCCFGCLICVAIPMLFFAVRRQQQPNWVPAPPSLMQNIIKQRYMPDKQEATQCAICLLDFSENEEVIALPCDPRHVFHTECITDWLKQNNVCPLCKKPISKEAIEAQKQRMQRSSTKRAQAN